MTAANPDDAVTHGRAPGRRIAQDSMALVVGLAAALVMIGWWTHTIPLIQIHHSLVPMQFNTALCFLLAAMGLAAVTRGWFAVSRVSGALIALMGVATLAEYLTGLNFGIDELLQQHYITTLSPFPGRMAHATATAFVLTGLSIFLLTFTRDRPRLRICAEVLAATTVSIALVAVIGYATGIEQAYGWGLESRMAASSALGFLLVGLCSLHFSLHHDQRHGFALRRTYVPLAIVTLTTSVSLWQALAAQDEVRVADATDAARKSIESAFVLHARALVRAVSRMAARWDNLDPMPRQRWESDAAGYLSDDFALIARMDGDFRISWLRTGSGPWPFAGGFRSYGAGASAACRAAMGSGSPAVTPLPGRTRGRDGMLIAAPLGGTGGCIIGASALRDLYESPVIDAERFGFSVTSGNAAPTAMPGRSRESIRERAGTRVIGGATWRLSAWPTESGISDLKSPLPVFLLACGVIATVLSLTLLALYQTAARRASQLVLQHEELKAAKAELEHLALYDALTETGNRNLFLRKFQTALATAELLEKPAALLIMDLNRFKDINDQLGHRAGDMVLQIVAARVASLLAERGEVFRIGGDEFAILLGAGTSPEDALETARQIADRAAESLELYGETRRIGVSIGIACFPRHGRDIDAMIRKADVAMYEAKTRGEPVVAHLDMGATTVLRLRKAREKPVEPAPSPEGTPSA